MAQYATAADLATLLNVTFDGADTDRAMLLLELVSDEIQANCHQQLTQLVDDVVTLPGNWSGELLLPGPPVTTVTTVTMDGDATSGWTLLNNRLWRTSPVEWVGNRTFAGYWGGPETAVQVTYTHGHTTVPDVARATALRAAARAWNNPQQSTQMSLGAWQESMVRLAGTWLTDGDRTVLTRAGLRRTAA